MSPQPSSNPPRDNAASRSHCRQLEAGEILQFPRTPWDFSAEDRHFLLEQRQSAGQHHKNIAYRPASDRLSGFATKDPGQVQQLHEVLRRYSQQATAFLARLLPNYAACWKQDYASFRPFQEQGREARMSARNDLLHVDAFPTRPTNGGLILRIFTNINPLEPRCWKTGAPVAAWLPEFWHEPGFPRLTPLAQRRQSTWKKAVGRLCRAVGVHGPRRSPYDQFMLDLHHWMKQNETYQREAGIHSWSFAPGATWIVFTDVVPHAALSGQYALEQTFIVPRAALVDPSQAPASVVEQLCGGPVTFEERGRAAA